MTLMPLNGALAERASLLHGGGRGRAPRGPLWGAASGRASADDEAR